MSTLTTVIINPKRPEHVHHLLPDGWKLRNDVPMEHPCAITPYTFLRKKDDGLIGGEEMVRRANEIGTPRGLFHLEGLLEISRKIPHDWMQQQGYIVFPDAVAMDLGGRYRVACLCYYKDELYSDWVYLDCNFCDNDLIALE